MKSVGVEGGEDSNHREGQGDRVFGVVPVVLEEGVMNVDVGAMSADPHLDADSLLSRAFDEVEIEALHKEEYFGAAFLEEKLQEGFLLGRIALA